MFKKYSSITNHYDKKFVDRIKLELKDEIFVATEKIHGANFSFIHNLEDGVLNVAKRSGIIQSGENFYNWEYIDCNVFENIRNSIAYIKKLYPYMDIKSIQFIGELYGGNYPHNNVEKIKEFSPIQKGVYYYNKIGVMIFDMLITYKKDSEYKTFYMPFNQVEDVCRRHNIPLVPIIKTGKINELLEIDVENIKSQVYKYHELPEIDDNVVEGIVIKPYEKDVWFGMHRVIIKKKGSKFKEKQRIRKPKIEKQLTDEQNKVLNKLLEYVNVNRIHNLKSKIGEDEFNFKKFGKIMGMLNKDILEEYERENKNTLDKKEWKQVTKEMNKFTSNLLRKYLMEEV